MSLNWYKEISSTEIVQCREFAYSCYETNKDEYARRGQTNKPKIIYDIVIGKMAEIATQAFLIEHKKMVCTEPDFAIYSARKKSFDADLTATSATGEEFYFHVKAQDVRQAQLFETSWLFQKNDKLTAAPDSNEIISLCTVENDIVCIQYMKPANALLGKYQQPKIVRLQETKLVIYAKELT